MMKDWRRHSPDLEDIEQLETTLWVREQLKRLENFVRENGADEDMLEVIDFFREENERWGVPDVEELLRSGRLLLPSAELNSH